MPTRTFKPVTVRQIAPPAVKPPTHASSRARMGGAVAGMPRFATQTTRTTAPVRNTSDHHRRWESEARQVAEAVTKTPPPSHIAVPAPVRTMVSATTDTLFQPPRVRETARARNVSSSGSPLGANIRHQIEAVTGVATDALRVHTGPEAHRAAAGQEARAFTTGSHIYLHEKESAADPRVIAHEATHAIQQTATTHAADPRAPPVHRATAPTLSRAPPGLVQRLPLDIAANPLAWPYLSSLSRDLRQSVSLLEDAGFDAAMARVSNGAMSAVLRRFPLVPQHFGPTLEWIRSTTNLKPQADLAAKQLLASDNVPLGAGLQGFAASLRDMFSARWRRLSTALDATRQTFAWFRGQLAAEFRALGNAAGLSELGGAIADLTTALRANRTLLDQQPWLLNGIGDALGCDEDLHTTTELIAWVDRKRSAFLYGPTELRRLAGEIERSLDFVAPLEATPAFGQQAAPYQGFLGQAAVSLDDPDSVPDDAPLLKRLLPELQRSGGMLTQQLGEATQWPDIFVFGLARGTDAWVKTLQLWGDNHQNWLGAIGHELNTWVTSAFDVAAESVSRIFAGSGTWLSRVEQLFIAMEPAMLDENTKEVKPSLLIRALRKLGVPPELLDSIQRAASALGKVVRHPFRFFKNLARSIVHGLHQFIKNIGRHLMDAIAKWVFGEVAVHWDGQFTLPKALGWVASLIGLTVDHFLVVLGRKYPKAAEKVRRALKIGSIAVRWIILLYEKNYAQLWQDLQGYLYNFWSQLVMKAQDLLINDLLSRGVSLLVGFLTPGLRQAVSIIKDIYRRIKQLKAQAERMMTVVNSVCDHIKDIVDAGDDLSKLKPTIDAVEQLAARALAVAVRFVAEWIGLGDIPSIIRNAFDTVRTSFIEPIYLKLIDLTWKVWEWLAEQAAKVTDWRDNRSVFQDSGAEVHTLLFEGDSDSAELKVKSDAKPLKEYWSKRAKTTHADQVIVDQINEHAKHTDRIKRKTKSQYDEKDGEVIRDHFTAIARLLAQLGGTDARPSTQVKWTTLNQVTNKPWDDGADMHAEVLSLNPGGLVGSEPYEESALWNKVKVRKGAYVRGHLLNHQVHGPGSKQNLIPITVRANNRMKNYAENDVKRGILDLNVVVRYDVRPRFLRQPGSRKYIPEEADLPSNIEMRFIELQKEGTEWKPVPGKRPISSIIPNDLPSDDPVR